MAIIVFFNNIQNCPTAKYYETLRRLEQAGAGAPTGQLSHVMYEKDGRPHVVNVYDTPENFEAFGNVLMPILAELGIDAGAPVVMPAENVQIG
jgi:hypothetical protein